MKRFALLLLLASAPAAAQSPPAVDSLIERGMLQEAAWALREAGDTAAADGLLARLERILRGSPRRATPLGMDSQGVSYTFRLGHDGGVQSIFKVDGSDIFCPECGADREVASYVIDRLLGFDLTPMTVFHAITDSGDTLRGSAMYWIRGARLPADVGLTKPDALRLFDAVLGNSDRHPGNWLVAGGRVVAIDHNRAMEYRPSATRPVTCWETEVDSIRRLRALGAPYERYRTLPADSLAAAVDGVLAPDLARQFVEMRDRVVARIEARAADPGRQLPLVDCAR